MLRGAGFWGRWISELRHIHSYSSLVQEHVYYTHTPASSWKPSSVQTSFLMLQGFGYRLDGSIRDFYHLTLLIG